MNNQEAYNIWSVNYDTIENKTRDMEGLALQKMLSSISFSEVLEIGCGTGKNTMLLSSLAKRVHGVDYSSEMINKAKEKTKATNVIFTEADITQQWNFTNQKFDLVTCSLILEHIKDLNFVFEQAFSSLSKGGIFYIGELHPFKQYKGSKAHFETSSGTIELESHIHSISDYFNLAVNNHFECIAMREWFDNDDKTTIPRLITFLFRKK